MHRLYILFPKITARYTRFTLFHWFLLFTLIFQVNLGSSLRMIITFFMITNQMLRTENRVISWTMTDLYLKSDNIGNFVTFFFLRYEERIAISDTFTLGATVKFLPFLKNLWRSHHVNLIWYCNILCHTTVMAGLHHGLQSKKRIAHTVKCHFLYWKRILFILFFSFFAVSASMSFCCPQCHPLSSQHMR